ncbi:MAG: FAD-dependent oxidoreductase [Candidatus Omnitrophota bacterium]
MKVYDLIIIGAGPAGITAAVYAARKKMDFLVLTIDIGGQAGWSSDVENYTGYQFISGPELVAKFQEHMNSFGIKVQSFEPVKSVFKQDHLIKTVTEKAEYLSKTVIIATGKKSKLLNVPGEDKFRNKGVTYCATCDGPLYKGKEVAVIGGGNSALDAVLQLMKICPKVYVINSQDFFDADQVMIEKIQNTPEVEIWHNAKVKEIYGGKDDNTMDFVQGISISQKEKISQLKVKGVFIEIGLIPNSSFTQGINKNTLDEIIVDCFNQTNLSGIFAAGDVTNVPEKQIIIASGEGSKACLRAFKYLSTNKL